jgi:hypothetical protein
MKTTHYIYELRNPITNEFYIGVRSCKGNPIDDTYMGSMASWNVDKSILVKTIIDDTFVSRDEANKREIELLKENITNPLNRNYHIPSIGFCCYGIKHSDEYRNKLSILKKSQYSSNPQMVETNRTIQKSRWNDELRNQWSVKMKSVNSTKEYRQKQIESAKDKSKPIIQFSKSGDFIKEYNSINEAAKELNIDKTCISRNCNGKYKTAFGYVWKFKN